MIGHYFNEVKKCNCTGWIEKQVQQLQNNYLELKNQLLDDFTKRVSSLQQYCRQINN